ncbi:MAG TPA: FtsL-like putative cell division protein [Mucilaginibacter sp.]|jgi:hypothetical protein|nr:FtsL-like putative cell division protein [Mucilaginibacter sp.]
MTNRLRTQVEEEDEEQQLIVDEKPVREIADNYLFKYFNKKFTAEAATRALPFVLFMALLGMIYIANRNFAEKNIRDIDKIGKQVNELSWQYKSVKARLAFKSTLTEVVKKVDTLGLKQPVTPPQVLKAEEDKDEH